MNTLLIICIFLLLFFLPITFYIKVDNLSLNNISQYKDKIHLYICLSNSIRFDFNFIFKKKKTKKKRNYSLFEKIFSYVEISNLLIIIENNNVFSGTLIYILLDYLKVYFHTHFLSVKNDKYENHYHDKNDFLSCYINIKLRIRTINILLAYINNVRQIQRMQKNKKGKRLYVES